MHSQRVSVVLRMEPKKDESKKPILRIENIYPHAFWLEKFTKENRFQATLFEDYLPNTANSDDRANFYLSNKFSINRIQLFSQGIYNEILFEIQRNRHDQQRLSEIYQIDRKRAY